MVDNTLFILNAAEENAAGQISAGQITADLCQIRNNKSSIN